jgi:thiamine biosynthesis lipoprotein
VPTQRVVERSVYLMGTRATLVASAPSRSAAVDDLDQMLETLELAEAELSTWRAGSVLSRLNRQPVGHELDAPDWLCALLSELASWNELTAGAFDPGVGSLVDAWNLRGDGRSLSREAVASARARTGLRHLSVRDDPCSATRRVDATIDAGGFGKGFALDRVAELGTSGLVDLGGQVAVFGRNPTGGWPVTIAHPQQRELPVVEVRLNAGSLAVSGGSERDHQVDGGRVGHILDPRIGRPISRDISVVVWHERALVADVLATGLYVMGEDEGRAWADAMDVAACFLIPNDNNESDEVPTVTLSATRAFRSMFLDSFQTDVRESESRRNEGVEDVEEHERRVHER